MKIKRYFAKDVRTAIQMVRNDQGPDAVIMSNNKLDDGVEIIAAIDYDDDIFTKKKPENKVSSTTLNDSVQVRESSNKYFDEKYFLENKNKSIQNDDIKELKSQINSIKDLLEGQMASLAWSDLRNASPHHAQVIKRLVSLGFSETLSTQVVEKLPLERDASYLWRHVLAELVSRVSINKKNIFMTGGIIALVGPTGVGKTTTAAKLAARFAQKHGKRKVALITIDNYRVAAYEQLKVYGKLIDIPVRVAESHSDLNSILNDYYDKELIIIDTAGMAQYDKNNMEQAAILDQERFNVKKTLVISAATQRRAINDIIKSFNCYSLSDCIVTKMDESPSHGFIIDALIINSLKLSFITDGQKVPEDIHPAVAHNLISRCVAIRNSDTDMPSDLMMAMNFGEESINACV